MVIDSVAELEDPVGPLVGSNTHKTLVGDLLNIRKLSLTLPGEVKVVSLPCGEWKIYTDILVHMESSIADILISSDIEIHINKVAVSGHGKGLGNTEVCHVLEVDSLEIALLPDLWSPRRCRSCRSSCTGCCRWGEISTLGLCMSTFEVRVRLLSPLRLTSNGDRRTGKGVHEGGEKGSGSGQVL